jgi:hypothetical protein
MKDFLKYLVTRPMTVMGLLFCIGILTGVTILLFVQVEETWPKIVVPVLLAGISFAVFYHPYKSWRDGSSNK